MAEDKRTSQLPNRSDGFRNGSIPFYNPTSDLTEQSLIKEAIGGVKADFDWQVDVTYVLDDLVFSNNRVWRALTSTTGQKPSEGAIWTEENISIADGITSTQHAVGVFTINNSKVVVSNVEYFLQTAAPFLSSDFNTELIAGDWGAGSTPVGQLVTAAATLPMTNQYSRFIFNGGASTWTMFELSGNSGKLITIHNRGTGAITLDSNGGADDFYDLGVAVNTKNIDAGETYSLYNDGTYFIIH